MIAFKCGGCGVALRVADDKAGKRGKCPNCGGSFVVPPPAPQAASSASSAGPPAAVSIMEPVASEDLPADAPARRSRLPVVLGACGGVAALAVIAVFVVGGWKKPGALTSGPLSAAASGELDRSLVAKVKEDGEAFAARQQRPGWMQTFFTTSGSLEDGPYQMKLSVGGRQATIRHNWPTHYTMSEGRVTCSQPRRGVLIRTESELLLPEQNIPANTLLYRNANGWEIVSPSQAVRLLQPALAATAERVKGSEDSMLAHPQAVAALGCAILGAEGRPAAPALQALLRDASLDAFDRLAVAKAVVEIGDPAALPALKEFAEQFARELPAWAKDANQLVEQMERKR